MLHIALVAASREAVYVHQFFVYLTFIINIVVAFSKHNDKMQYTQVANIESMVASNEIKIERVANQINICNDLEMLDGLFIFIIL
jgi:hypothetical protein